MVKQLLVTTIFMLSACAQSIPEQHVKHDDASSKRPDTFTVQVLGINDFHGQVLSVNGEGGMYDLSRHLLHKIESTQEHTFVLHGGDHVGASPAESALLQDEPSIELLNILQRHCQNARNNTCKIMGTAGNHEFDEGSQELLRLLDGGKNHEKGPFIHALWHGSNYETLSANVVDIKSQKTLLKPYSTFDVNGVTIGFIGISLDTTPELVVPGSVDDLVFQDQASVVSKISEELQAHGIQSIIVIVHDGSEEQAYEGPTKHQQSLPLDSKFGKFVTALPNAVDLVVSGHSHEFTNAYVQNHQGKNILVTQAFDKGRAYADISLTISTQTKDVIEASAEVHQVKASHTFNLSEQAKDSVQEVGELIQQSTDFAKQYTQSVINTYEPKALDASLGQFIADSHKHAAKTDLAVMNDGGVRAELNAGPVTWGDLFAIQPFGNSLMVKSYTGAQLLEIMGDPEFHWSTGTRIDSQGQLLINHKVAQLDKEYQVGGNAFVMNSGGFAKGKFVRLEGLDIDGTVEYIKQLTNPFNFLDMPKSQ